MIAVPMFGYKSYKSHISIDRRFGFIRESAVTAASAPDGRQLKRLVSPGTPARRSGRMLTSRIHRRKPAGRPMPRNVARANAKKSAIRAAVEHVFAHQKARFGLFIRTIGLARAEAKLTLANLAYNFDRLVLNAGAPGGESARNRPEGAENGPDQAGAGQGYGDPPVRLVEINQITGVLAGVQLTIFNFFIELLFIILVDSLLVWMRAFRRPL